MMKKIAYILSALMMAAALSLSSGCISSGTKSISDDYMRSKVVKGESTRREVEIMFGRPNTKADLGSDGEVWEYNYTKTTPLGQKSVDFKIKFNSKGIVERVDESQSDVKVFQN
ncbi:MAG: outer membrane protein assembly factor BamE [Sedimentisphaerales bacterium]|nr:outer membrane protein assembly factor BamE [Sedimentisphaerales bacterium]MBN2841512.1 outer membrane protein assembly factor BamE [Sedimentisphaerales bacterium]